MLEKNADVCKNFVKEIHFFVILLLISSNKFGWDCWNFSKIGENVL